MACRGSCRRLFLLQSPVDRHAKPSDLLFFQTSTDSQLYKVFLYQHSQLCHK